MSAPLISASQLRQAKRILYMTHLAIGDYMYQGLYLQALKQQYPHLQIDIWIDDCRKKPKAWHAGRNNTLCQWLDEEVAVEHIYPIAESQQQREQHIQTARQKDYDLVVFFATQRCEQFAKYAREAAPKAFIVGTKANPWSTPFSKWLHFKKIDRFFLIKPEAVAELTHISDVYRYYFHNLLELAPLEYSASRTLRLHIPEVLQQQANKTIQQLSNQANINQGYCIFINHLSTTAKRDYGWQQVKKLLQELQQANTQAVFVLNVPPAEIGEYQQRIQQDPLLSTLPLMAFTAQQHFYQLPAMIQAANLVITVETAIMHIAASLGKQQIALVRQSAKQWQPLNADAILFAGSRVDDIQVQQVVAAYKQLATKST